MSKGRKIKVNQENWIKDASKEQMRKIAQKAADRAKELREKQGKTVLVRIDHRTQIYMTPKDAKEHYEREKQAKINKKNADSSNK